MRFSKSELLSLAKSLGYRPEILEKVILLISLLNKFFEDDFLKDKFVLKGGTALNLFFLNLPRLSVDIDLNYIGSTDREQMLKDKEQIRRRVSTVCSKLDIQVDRDPSDEHSGGKFLLSCDGTLNQRSNLELDINFILRTPLFSPVAKNSIKVENHFSAAIPTLDIHEIIAGKLAALFTRTAARDLYDVHQIFCQNNLNLDYEKLRLAFIVYGAMSRTNWLDISLEKISFEPQELHDNLLPVLSLEETQGVKDLEKWAHDLQIACKQALQFLFPFNTQEIEFLNLLNHHGEINAALLSTDLHMLSLIQSHPAIEWKAFNVKRIKNK